jgi:replicative DNA helicase
LKTLNAWLDGGLDIGEFGLVMGQTGIGKTFWLCNIAAATYMFGGKVFYYTFELGDVQIKRRIDGRISGFTYEERKEKTGKLKARLEREAAHGGEIVIKHFPAKEVGVPGIIGHINKMKVKHNLTPDLILIDYIDLVKPFIATGDDWKELGDIANALHGQIAQKMGTRVWSVSQIKTESFYQRFDLRAIRRSAEKINIADVVLAISQSQEDEKNDTMMVELLKLRRGHRARGTFKVKLDYARGTMTELIAPLDDTPVTGERMGVIS